MEASPSNHTGPPLPLSVGWNRWDELQLPPPQTWIACETVTVVVTHYDSLDALALVLAGLATQTYPRHLMEVIVADDGSPDPAAVKKLAVEQPELDIDVLVQERRGFGAGRARNMGAAAASGSILVFLDCDMLPEPTLIEAHARWHHVYQDLVTLGFRLHVDAGVTPEAVRQQGVSGTLAGLFAGGDQVAPAYIEGHMLRTNSLTSADDDLFRVVTSGNFSVRKETYSRVGGFDEIFNQWGGEDTELGYRLFSDGNVLVPEREALCWHLGLPGFDDPAKQRSLYEQRALLAHLIAHSGFRRCLPGRTYTRPRVTVIVTGGTSSGERLQAVVESVLGQEMADLEVAVEIPAEHPEATWVERQLGRDLRVRIDKEASPEPPTSPFVVRLPENASLRPGALQRIITRLSSTEEAIGVLHITVAGQAPVRQLGWAALGRALRRGQRVDPHDALTAAGELFGELWVGGEDYGVADIDVAAHRPRAAQKPSGAPAPSIGGHAKELAALADAVNRLPSKHRTMLLRVAMSVVRSIDAAKFPKRPAKGRLRASTRRRIARLLPEPVKAPFRPLWHRLNQR